MFRNVEKKPEPEFEKILKNIFSNKVIENTSLNICKVTVQ